MASTAAARAGTTAGRQDNARCRKPIFRSSAVPGAALSRIATSRAPLVPCAYIAVRSCQGRAHAHWAAPEDAGAMRHTGTGRFGDWQPVTYLVRTSDVASGAELWFERRGFRLPWPFCDPAGGWTPCDAAGFPASGVER